MNYKESTQRERWQFTPFMIAELRDSARQSSMAALTGQADGETNNAAGRSRADGQPDASTSGAIDPLSAEEEAVLCRYYQTRVQVICKKLHFSHKVQATAITYLKRFYLQHGVVQHDPQQLMPTAIYLACKASESYISATELARLVSTDAGRLLKLELLLLEGVKFDLVVHTPYGAIDGFLQDLADVPRTGGLREILEAASDSVKAGAYAAADALMLTDAPLLYSPSLLALAALRSAFRKVNVRFVSLLEHLCTRPDCGLELQQLLSRLSEIDQHAASAATPLAHAELVRIDRKLKACRAPLLESRQQTSDEDPERAQRREAKAAARRAAQAAAAQSL